MYSIVTLNDCKASSFNRNMCGMKTKQNKYVLKEFLLFLVIPTMLHGFKELGWDITKSVGIKCAMYDQHVGHGTRLY